MMYWYLIQFLSFSFRPCVFWSFPYRHCCLNLIFHLYIHYSVTADLLLLLIFWFCFARYFVAVIRCSNFSFLFLKVKKKSYNLKKILQTPFTAFWPWNQQVIWTFFFNYSLPTKLCNLWHAIKVREY